MTIEEIKLALATAMALRVPRKDPDEGQRAHIERLEDHMLQLAYVRGDAEEALAYLNRLRDTLMDQWNMLTGYEMFLPNRPKDRLTEKDYANAKAQVAPDLAANLRDVRQLRDDISRQIVRLSQDEGVVSRCYTMKSGG